MTLVIPSLPIAPLDRHVAELGSDEIHPGVMHLAVDAGRRDAIVAKLAGRESMQQSATPITIDRTMELSISQDRECR
jgi:hypothetical protein